MTKALEEYTNHIEQTQNKIDQIKNHPTMLEILKDAFGGIMYNVANQNKYDTTELLALWENLTPNEQDLAGGIISGAISFIKGEC